MPWLEAIFAEGGSGTMAKAAGLASARPPLDQLEMLSSQAAGLRLLLEAIHLRRLRLQPKPVSKPTRGVGPGTDAVADAA
jgi:hypothetical protein